MDASQAVRRVQWHEGLFLTPQHLQQAERHGEHRLRKVLGALHPYTVGFSRLDLDRDALGTDRIALATVAGILPDGTAFSAPAPENLPDAREVGSRLAPGTDRLLVYLATPTARPGAPVVASLDGSRVPASPLRYKRETITVDDEVDGGASRDVLVSAMDLRLKFAGEDLDGFTVMPVAAVVRNPSGGLALADDFAPPCLAYGCSPMLTKLVKKLVDICCARSTALAAGRRQRVQGQVEFSVSETANYLLLHTLNSAIPGLMHLLRTPATHPERLYQAISALAGSLHTFQGEGHPKDLPAYLHDEPHRTFAELDAKLMALLEHNVALRYTPIPLTRGPGGIHQGRIPETILEGHRLYLSIQSSAPTDKVMQQAPTKAKIAATSRIPSLLAQAMKGLALTYQSVPPAEIPAQPGTQYFELVRDGSEWTTAVETRSIAVFLPPDFTDVKMEFLAIKE